MRLMLVGCGKMGGAMLDGWLRMRAVAPQDIVVVEPHPARDTLEQLEHVYGTISAVPETLLEAAAPDAVLLAVKPELAEEVAAEIASRRQLRKALLLTVIPGKPFVSYVNAFGGMRSLRIVRCMPNTPCSIGRGVTGLCPNINVRDTDRQLAETLLRAIGDVVWVKTEGELEALMAISGCGPAFVFHYIEALTDAGIALGLAPDVAAKLARCTVAGSGAYAVASSNRTIEALKAEVANPGGPTAMGLEVYRRSNFKSIVLRAAEAALARSLNS